MWLIVGGSGFIGTNFAKFLIENSYDFKIFDKNRPKYLPKNVKTIKGDIRNKNKLSKTMKDCDVIFNLVTVPPSTNHSKKEIYDIDVNGTKNILMAAKENKVKRIVFTSSASHVYGSVDPGSCPLKEESILNPINEYGRNKAIIENLCKKESEETDLEIVILRLSMVLGAYDFDPILLENAIPILLNKTVFIPGNGNSKGQSIHVKDVNTALLASIEKLKMSKRKHEIFNISGKEVQSINEWINLFKKISESKSKTKHVSLPIAKMMAYIAWGLHKTKIHPSYLYLMTQDQYFDISKAKQRLKWEPRYNMDKAIQDTIDFIKREIIKK